MQNQLFTQEFNEKHPDFIDQGHLLSFYSISSSRSISRLYWYRIVWAYLPLPSDGCCDVMVILVHRVDLLMPRQAPGKESPWAQCFRL